jgi:hypothetical protein
MHIAMIGAVDVAVLSCQLLLSPKHKLVKNTVTTWLQILFYPQILFFTFRDASPFWLWFLLCESSS